MPNPKKQQIDNDSASSRKYNLRQNKKDKQTSKNSARSKKTYTEDAFDLPEGVYDSFDHTVDDLNIKKQTFKKNIIEVHSPSNSPPHSDDEDDQQLIQLNDEHQLNDEQGSEEEKKDFDDSYFEPVEFKETTEESTCKSKKDTKK